jgi:hypothetical protein
MKKSATPKDIIPLARMGKAAADVPTGDAFRPEWIDFENGIRVGNLEPHERITQILKYGLESRHGTPFVTDRWGRGVFWQWICWLPRANREAKPVSHGVNFGCAKLFISMDRDTRTFEFGLQVERGYLRGGESWVLRDDWDWHRLMKQCAKGTALDEEMARLVRREGFTAAVDGEGGTAAFRGRDFKSAAQIRAAARKCASDQWAGFQLFYPMPEKELRSCTGRELILAVLGAFAEVVPAMNMCMQVPLAAPTPGPPLRT